MRRVSTAESSCSDSSSDSDVEDQHTEPVSATLTQLIVDKQGSQDSSPAPQPQHCVVLMRGVVWKSEEVEVMKLWQNLLRFWPVTFASNLVQPQGALQAHGGTDVHNIHAVSLSLQM